MFQRNSYTVGILWDEPSDNESNARFAARLANALGVPLRVYVKEFSAKVVALATRATGRTWQQINADRTREIVAMVAELTSLPAAKIEVRTYDADKGPKFAAKDILVNQNSNATGVNVLIPKAELAFDCRHKGSLMIPFGDGQSGLQAAGFGLPLAAALACPVALYHTTWRNEAIDDERPALHMCDAANSNLEQLMESAAACRVAFKPLIKLEAEDVASSIVYSALREKASFIVMTRNPDMSDDSYVDQVIEKSPVPVLVVNNAARRSE